MEGKTQIVTQEMYVETLENTKLPWERQNITIKMMLSVR